MAKNCKTPDQITAEQAAKLADMEAEIDRLNAEFRRTREEDDNTDIRIAPIEVTDDQSTVELTGLYFNRKEIREEDEPAQELVIESDVLDRSSGMILGRFEYKADNRAKIVYKVFLDGKFIQESGTNLPYESTTGKYDTVLFKYPNSARANTPGRHKVHVEYGMIVGIVEKQLGLLDWGKIKGATSADFLIRLLPHKTA
jgi:hypothetical protein